MTFLNPLNHWRGAELKEPILAQRALLGKRVRHLLLMHPSGMTVAEIRSHIPEGPKVLDYLRRSGFARSTQRHGEIWFASEPRPFRPDGA